MPALLVYTYATGAFARRRIEQSTVDNVAVRYPCADAHPDHGPHAVVEVAGSAGVESLAEKAPAFLESETCRAIRHARAVAQAEQA